MTIRILYTKYRNY